MTPDYSEIIDVSPSQISTFRQCQRRWAWGAIAKIREPQKPSAALGELVHKHLEAWLEHATLPSSETDAGQIAASMIQHCPTPKTVLVEQQVRIDRPGYRINARADVLGPTLVPPLVQDHKTSSDIALYANTEEDLLTDPQAIVYAAGLFLLLAKQGLPLVDVEVRFTYGSTKGKRYSKRVSVLFSLEYVERMMVENIDVTAQDIVRTKRTCTNPLDLEPTIGACGDFGGCHWRSGPTGKACNLSPSEFLMSATQQPANSIMSLFGGTPTPINPPAAAPPPPAAPDAPLQGAPPQGAGSLSTALAAAPPPPPPVGLSALFSMPQPPAVPPPAALGSAFAAPPPPQAPPPPPAPAQAHASVPQAVPSAPGFLGLLAAQGAVPPPPPPAPVMPPLPAGIPVPLGGGTVMMTPPLPAPVMQSAPLTVGPEFFAPGGGFVPGPSLPDEAVLRMLLEAFLQRGADADKVQLACALIRAGHPAGTVATAVENVLRDLGGQP